MFPIFLAWTLACAQSQPAARFVPQVDNSAKQESFIAEDESLYLKLRLDATIKLSKLKPGDVVEGKLSQGVYRGDHELFPEGSRIRLTVDRLVRQRRVPNDHWPWVIKAFTPRHQNSPTFSSATVFLPEGREAKLRVSLISMRSEKEIVVHARKVGTRDTASPSDVILSPAVGAPTGGTAGQPAIALEAAEVSPEPRSAFTLPAGAITLPSGMQAKVVLLGSVSASKSRAGDSFRARVVEPVRLDSRVVLPEGTVLDGTVVKNVPPRMLSRAGSLLLKFTGMTLPGGMAVPVLASVSGADLDRRSHTKIDAEGRMTGDHPGKVWMLINGGVAAGIAKEADDTLQLIIESIVSTATDASTAGSGRIIAACASGIFLLTRHGRDVVLPKFTEMRVTFDRPVSLSGPSAAGAPGN